MDKGYTKYIYSKNNLFTDIFSFKCIGKKIFKKKKIFQ